MNRKINDHDLVYKIYCLAENWVELLEKTDSILASEKEHYCANSGVKEYYNEF